MTAAGISYSLSLKPTPQRVASLFGQRFQRSVSGVSGPCSLSPRTRNSRKTPKLDARAERYHVSDIDRRSSCALMATITVLSDISAAPTAGDSTKPQRARSPAASGMATML